jgi:hypothetical protein
VTPRQWILAFGLVLTLALVWMAPSESLDPATKGQGAPDIARQGALKGGANGPQSSAQPPVIALRQRDELPIARLSPQAFDMRSWTPPPPPPPPPGPPIAPPLPFVYLGKKLEDGTWEVFLERGDRVLHVRERDVIEATWRVEAIRESAMTFQYLPLAQAQTLNFGTKP